MFVSVWDFFVGGMWVGVFGVFFFFLGGGCVCLFLLCGVKEEGV